MLNTDSLIGENMTSVINNAAASSHKARVQGMGQAGDATTIAGEAQGMAAFFQALEAALDINGRNQDGQTSVAKSFLANALQNLPKKTGNNDVLAKNADSLQLLSAALAAQGLLSQAPEMASNLTQGRGLQGQGDSVQNAVIDTSATSKSTLNQNDLSIVLALLKVNNSNSTSNSGLNLQLGDSSAEDLSKKPQSGLSSTANPAVSDQNLNIKVLSLESGVGSNLVGPNVQALLAGAGQTLVDQTQKNSKIPSFDAMAAKLFDSRGSSQFGAGNLNPPKTQVSGVLAGDPVTLKSAQNPGETINTTTSEIFKSLETKNSSQQDEGLGVANTVSGNLPAQINANAVKLQMPVEQANLTSGPLHDQVIGAARSGGGRIALELTPQGQGTIRIDLRIDHNGQAHLIVESASEATKAMFDQGGQQLKQEFMQMGLNLSLDLRQGNGFSQQAQGQNQDPQAVNEIGGTTHPALKEPQGLNSLAVSSVQGDNGQNSAVFMYA